MTELMREHHERIAHHGALDHLMLLEHAPVITITRQHELKSIKTSEDAIKNDGIELFLADRGGDVTFHGPGQLVGYPIMRVKDAETAIRGLEKALFLSLRSLGLKNIHCQPGFSGIWCKEKVNQKIKLKKLAALGMGLKDGVSKHGFALNIDIDYAPYLRHIIPCGLKDRGVITLKEAFSLESLPMPNNLAIVEEVAQSIADIFYFTLSWRDQVELTDKRGITHG